MESIGTFKGKEDVYRRKGYDSKGNAGVTFWYAHEFGRWFSWSGRQWEELNAHQCGVIKRLRDRALAESVPHDATG